MTDLQKKNRKWEDLLGPGLAVLTALLAVLLVTVNVWMVASQSASTVSTLLLNVLTLVFSTVCTVWVGRWSALRENKAFIRAALRTTYGLKEGLEAVEQTALEATARMRTRVGLDPSATAQLWEESVGRVVDQVRALVRRAQETVANWGEFGPEEVEALSTAETAKASAVFDIVDAKSQVQSMLERFGSSLAPDQTAKLQERIEALESAKDQIASSSALAFPTAGEARRLLAVGAFEDAIDAYTSLISAQPESHTLYIGRARARYLKGDREGATADLLEADRLCPTDPAIARMRSDIAQGRNPDVPAARVDPPWKEATDAANAALARGETATALSRIQEADEKGLHPVFVGVNRAMALTLAGSLDDARSCLTGIESLITGPFIRIQARLVYAICDALDGKSVESSKVSLREAAHELALSGARFQVARSPVQHLIIGLSRLGRTPSVLPELIALAQSESVFSLAPPVPPPSPANPGDA